MTFETLKRRRRTWADESEELCIKEKQFTAKAKAETNLANLGTERSHRVRAMQKDGAWDTQIHSHGEESEFYLKGKHGLLGDF